MARRIPIVVATTLSLLAAGPVAAIEPTTVARRVEPSMVHIFVQGATDAISASGFVIDTQGHIATAYHVVQPHIENGWDLFVVESGRSPEARRTATVVKAYPDEDLAILKVDGLERPPVILSEGGADTPAKGMTVFAIGYPGAGERLGADSGTSFTVGVANRIFTGAWTPDGPRIRIIQHSAATNPGSSGGPIVNPCGQVVGMNTEREMAMLVTPGGLPIIYDVIQGVFFASHVSVLIDKLKALEIPYNGTRKVCRIILGVASTNFPWYGLAVLVVVAALILLLVRSWPRRVVHVIILGGSAARNGARALRHRLFRFPWRSGRPEPDWRLYCDDAEGGPIDIVITHEDLHRAPKGLVIGCDPSCDRCLPAEGIADQHVQIVQLGDKLGVADLNSGTGTAVDDRPVDPNDGPAELTHGGRLRLGNITFRVERR